MSGISSLGRAASAGVMRSMVRYQLAGFFLATCRPAMAWRCRSRCARRRGYRARSANLPSSSNGLTTPSPVHCTVPLAMSLVVASASLRDGSTSSAAIGAMKALSAPVATPMPTLHPASSSAGNCASRRRSSARWLDEPSTHGCEPVPTHSTSDTPCAGLGWPARSTPANWASRASESAAPAPGRCATSVAPALARSIRVMAG